MLSKMWRYYVVGSLLVAALAAGYVLSQQTGKVGPTFGGDGTTPFVRTTRAASLTVQQQSGKYSEAVLRGNVYVATAGATGQAVNTAISTTGMMTLWNPIGSGKNFRVLKTSGGYISGTNGSGIIVYVVNNSGNQASPTGGTAVTPVNCLIGAANNSVAKTGFGQTLASSPTMTEVIASDFAQLATTANGYQIINDDVDGRYIVQPGTGISVEAVNGAGGTTPIMSFSFMWEEVVVGQE